MYVYEQMTGHGVGLRKKDGFSILGLSDSLSLVVGIVFIVLVVFLVSSVILEYEKISFFSSKLIWIALSISISFMFYIASWKFHIYHRTWYGSAHDARMEFYNKGFPKEKVDKYIDQLIEAGVLEKKH